MKSVRVKTGIHGLDPLIEGGFIPGSTILVTGGCGSGKTLFGAQFLYYGAKEHNEPGVFLSLEQPPDEIRADFADLGFDTAPLEKGKKLVIDYINPIQFIERGEVIERNVAQMLREHVSAINAKRVVVDSLAPFELYLKQPWEIRKKIYDLNQALQKLDVTAVLTSEVVQGGRGSYSRFGMEEFICDSVIVLDHYKHPKKNIHARSLFIKKMRRTTQDTTLYGLQISRGQGLAVVKVT